MTARRSGSTSVLISGGLWQVLASLVGFAYFPVLSRVLESSDLGAWGLLSVYSLLFGLTDLGLSVAVQRAGVRGDPAATRAALGLALSSVVCLTPVAASAAYMALSHLPPEWAPQRAGIAATAPLAFVAGFLLAYAMPFRAYLYTQGGVRRVALARVAACVVQVALVSSGFFVPATLRLLGVAATAAALAELSICVGAARRHDPQLPILPCLRGSAAQRQAWFVDGLGALAVAVFDVLTLRIDVLILAGRTASPPAIVAIYNYASRLVEQAYLLIKQLLPSLTPRLGAPAARGEAVQTGTAVFSSLALSGLAALTLNGQALILVLFGARFFRADGAAAALGLVVALLCVAFAILSSYEVSSPMLTLGGRTAWAAALPILLGGVVKYVIAFWGAPRWGILAIAGSASLGYAVTSVLTWAAARHVLSWTWLRVLRVFVTPALAGSTAVAVGVLLRPVSVRGWMESAASCALTGLAGVAVAAIALWWCQGKGTARGVGGPRMRVAFALGGTDAGRSGLGVYARSVLPELAAALRADGGSVVAIGEPREREAYASALRDVECATAPASFGLPALSALWYLARAGALARAAGADVLLCPAANRRLTAASRTPTVAVVHDLAHLMVPGKYDIWRTGYLRWVMLTALRTATEIVAVSSVTRRHLVAALGARGERVRVVPNGVDVVRFAPLPPDAPSVVDVQRRHALDRPYVLYPARLEHPGKNHVRLIRAWAGSSRLRSHLLVLCGGDWGAGQRIQAEAARLGLARNVRLLGFVPDGELPPLVAAADAVVLVGLCEGFGLPALEALAAGRPVCAADAGGLPEVVGPLACMCDPLDEQSIQHALERCVFDPVLRSRVAVEGPPWAGSWSWARTAAGLLEACRDAGGQRR